MAVTVAATGNAVVSASRSPSVTFGSYTPATDDVVVFFANNGAAAAAMTVTATWVNCDPSGGNTNVASDSHTAAAVYHKVTSAEAAAVTVAYTATNLWDANATGNVVGVVLRGVDPNVPVDSSNTTFGSGNTATPHILPGLTGSNLSNYSQVLGCVAKDLTGTWTTPTGWTARGSNNTNAGTALFTWDTLTAAGVSVAATNITPSAGDEYVTYTVAFTSLDPIPTTGMLTDNYITQNTVRWDWPAGTSATGGAAVVTAGTNLGSLSRYSLIGSSIVAEIASPGADFWFFVGLGTAGKASDSYAGFHVNVDISAYETIGGVTDFTFVSFNATNHRWLRLSESAGTLTWATSPTGANGTWTTLRTKAVGQAYSYVICALQGITGSTSFDNFNLPPGSTVPRSAVSRNTNRAPIIRTSLY